MAGQSVLDLSMMDPRSRRFWLFTKALENASFAEALSLAQAAEQFLSEKFQETADRRPEQSPATAFELKPAALEGHCSLVPMDAVIQYLRQCDEDVGSETDSSDELLARANRKRTTQGLLSFALLPVSPTQATRPDKPPRQAKKAASPRPPTARERAEWARRVVALPTAKVRRRPDQGSG
jgi:hypothetical protein